MALNNRLCAFLFFDTHRQYPTVDEVLGGQQGRVVRVATRVRPNNADADRYRVVIGCVGAHVVPATPLVYITVLANEEVVPYVIPSCGVRILRYKYIRCSASLLNIQASLAVFTMPVLYCSSYRVKKYVWLQKEDQNCVKGRLILE